MPATFVVLQTVTHEHETYPPYACDQFLICFSMIIFHLLNLIKHETEYHINHSHFSSAI